MHFTKWNGCGNDFVFINAMHMDDLKPVLDKCERICDRHFGIGADGIIFVLLSVCVFLTRMVPKLKCAVMESGALPDGPMNWAW